MGINKVQYGNTTLIDLTNDTVTADKLMQGYTAHDRSGALITGTATGGGTGAISVVDTEDTHGGTIRTITAVDISDTTAQASDVAQGKYFYTADGTKTAGTASGGSATIQPLSVTQNGTYTAPSGVDGYSPVTVNVSGGGGGTILKNIIRPDAELVQSYNKDSLFVEDDGGTIPSYTTSATTLQNARVVLSSIPIDLNDYHYYILERDLIVPIYNTNQISTGRFDYHFGVWWCDLLHIQNNQLKSLADGTLVNSNWKNVNVGNGQHASVYWSSATKSKIGSGTYGIYYATPNAPSISGSSSLVLSISDSELSMRGSGTYFTQTWWNALTDIRLQQRIELYRVPKNNLQVEGWQGESQLMHIADCINNNNGTLT